MGRVSSFGILALSRRAGLKIHQQAAVFLLPYFNTAAPNRFSFPPGRFLAPHPFIDRDGTTGIQILETSFVEILGTFFCALRKKTIGEFDKGPYSALLDLTEGSMKPIYFSRILLAILICWLAVPACTTPSPAPVETPPVMTEAAENEPGLHTVEWAGLGSLSYDPALAQSVEITNVEAIPPDPARMSKEWRPAYAQFRFDGYDHGRELQLPYPIAAAQVMVFHTVDFPSYVEGSPLDFPSQQQALSDLLDGGMESVDCAKPHGGQSSWLPFLPWVYGAQSFCARPQLLEFQGGRGIRYITYYTQDISPVFDPLVFYTFQGLTDDGAYYISAVFPVQTGVFPSDTTVTVPFENLMTVLAEQVEQMNAQPEDAFTPSLSQLDAVIESVTIQ